MTLLPLSDLKDARQGYVLDLGEDARRATCRLGRRRPSPALTCSNWLARWPR
ncbi:Uncharacterised protein [Chromobacterium violaceum]|uniref:Uncharacterized protein n=1 Tax=Chromobacterium violaceum TaxID=536 RepID=A0A3S4J5F1_CHRVL|nr:Uncharacterised protein [Chromobacterium violaceum]